MCPVSSLPKNLIRGVVWDVTYRCSFTPEYSVLVHTATPALAELNTSEPKKLYEANLLAITNAIEFASRHQLSPFVWLSSSGSLQ